MSQLEKPIKELERLIKELERPIRELERPIRELEKSIRELGNPTQELKKPIQDTRRARFSRFIGWLPLRHWLIHFGSGEESKTHRWLIPAVAFVVGLINSHFSTKLELPDASILLYMIACPYLGASFLYNLFCPSEIRGIVSQEGWVSRTQEKKKKLVEAMELEKKLRISFLDLIEMDITSRMGPHFLLGVDNEAIEKMKSILKTTLSKEVIETARSFSDDIKAQSHKFLYEINTRHPVVRLLIAGLLFLTISGSGIEFCEASWEIANSAGHISEGDTSRSLSR